MNSEWMNSSQIWLDLFVLIVMPYICKIFQNVSTYIILLDVTISELSLFSYTFMNEPGRIKINKCFEGENLMWRNNGIDDPDVSCNWPVVVLDHSQQIMACEPNLACRSFL